MALRPLPLALSALGLLTAACGSSPPAEADIYHDPALRPGRVAAEGADAQLLAQLDSLDAEGSLTAGGTTYQVAAPYEAASGRSCRPVEGPTGARLACNDADDGWSFVPGVLPTATSGGAEAER